MDILIDNKIEELKALLKNDERIIRLNKAEKEMEASEEVMALTYRKDVAATNYSDNLKSFGENNEITIKSLKELHKAKIELDSHPLVKEYLSAYKDVILLYKEVNDILFKDFKVECK